MLLTLIHKTTASTKLQRFKVAVQKIPLSMKQFYTRISSRILRVNLT